MHDQVLDAKEARHEIFELKLESVQQSTAASSTATSELLVRSVAIIPGMERAASTLRHAGTLATDAGRFAPLNAKGWCKP